MGIFSKKPTGGIPSTRAGRVVAETRREMAKKQQKDELAAKRDQKKQGGKR